MRRKLTSKLAALICAAVIWGATVPGLLVAQGTNTGAAESGAAAFQIPPGHILKRKLSDKGAYLGRDSAGPSIPYATLFVNAQNEHEMDRDPGAAGYDPDEFEVPRDCHHTKMSDSIGNDAEVSNANVFLNAIFLTGGSITRRQSARVIEQYAVSQGSGTATSCSGACDPSFPGAHGAIDIPVGTDMTYEFIPEDPAKPPAIVPRTFSTFKLEIGAILESVEKGDSGPFGDTNLLANLKSGSSWLKAYRSDATGNIIIKGVMKRFIGGDNSIYIELDQDGLNNADPFEFKAQELFPGANPCFSVIAEVNPRIGIAANWLLLNIDEHGNAFDEGSISVNGEVTVRAR